MCFSSGVHLDFRMLMYVKRHEQFEIGCGAILNKIYYYYYSYSPPTAPRLCFVRQLSSLSTPWVSNAYFSHGPTIANWVMCC